MNKCPECKFNYSSSSISKCKICNIKTCSIQCLLKHSQSHVNSSSPSQEKVSLLYSLRDKQNSILTENYPFITKGTFLPTAEFNPEYNFSNFSPVTLNGFAYELGSGSFGRVVLAKNQKTNKYCAIKTLNKTRIKQACGSLAVIYNEIKIHSRLIHKNIIRLYNVYENDTEIKMMMEYANKGTLYEAIKKGRSGFSESDAFGYFIKVVSAIVFLHENNVIHRDIKPENILLNEDNDVKLCDFGWSKEIDLSKRSTFCGTVEYMAPEIVNNECYDMGIDIWSLGILLYELVHGFSPFTAKTTHEIMIKIKEHNIKFYKKVSKECEDLVCALLDPKAETRMKAKDILTSSFVKKYTFYMSREIKDRTPPTQRETKTVKKVMWKSNSFNKMETNNSKENKTIEEVKGKLFRERSKAKNKIDNLLKGEKPTFKNSNIESFEDLRDNCVKEKKKCSSLSKKVNVSYGENNQSKQSNEFSNLETIEDINEIGDTIKKNTIIKTFNLIPHAKKNKLKPNLTKKCNKENVSNNIISVSNSNNNKKEEKQMNHDENSPSYFSQLIRHFLNI